MKEQNRKVILTCEHGGNEIPDDYAFLFEEAQDVLRSPLGFDVGALELLQLLSPVADFTLSSSTSRLLIDLNRTEHHPRLFSEYLRPVSPAQKKQIMYDYYLTYRLKVEEQIKAFSGDGHQVVHLSIHTFPPQDHGKERNADIGLLYDPSREPEVLISAKWRQLLELALPPLKVRYNYPKKGTADGFIPMFRKQFKAEEYVGLEIEVNQNFFTEDVEGWKILQPILLNTFKAAIQP